MKNQVRTALHSGQSHHKGIMEVLKEDMLRISVAAAVLCVGLMLVFYKESLLVVVRVAFAIIWLFIVPGFAVLYLWYDRLEFTERLIAAVPISAALVGIPSYYLGLLGFPIWYHAFALPIGISIIATGLVYLRNKQSVN